MLKVSKVLKGLAIIGLATSSFLTAQAAKKGSDLKIYQIQNVDKANLDKIADEYEIFVKLDESTFRVYVDSSEANNFLKLAPKAELVDNKYSFNSQRICESYRSIDQIYSLLDSLASKKPSIASVGTYGTSTNGKPLKFIKISDNSSSDESNREPVLIIDAATHGDECVTTETLVHHIEELVNKYDSDSEIKRMVDNTEIYFIPIVSPDSHRIGRYVHGVDPNRAYPGVTGSPQGRVQCIDKLMDFFAEKKPTGSMTWHGATNPGMILHPWGHESGPVSNDQTQVATYSKIRGAMKRGAPGFTAGSIIDTIYRAPNSSIDYYFMKDKPGVYEPYQTYSVGIEVQGSKVPGIGQIKRVYVPQTRAMTHNFIKAFIR